MATRLVRSHRFVAVLLGLDGALNGAYLNDVLIVVPFAIAAIEFYMAPPTWRLRRWLMLFTVVVVALSMAQAVDYVVGWATGRGSMVLLQGISLLIVNALVLICFMAMRSVGEVRRLAE